MDRITGTSIVSCGLALLLTVQTAGAINCYSCSSRSGSNINCEDPFHPALSDYEISCMVPKEGHIGKFPANFCVKVKGTAYGTGERLVIRTCTLENMENQCGAFRYENNSMTGCVLTCNTDGCNSGGQVRAGWITAATSVLAVALFLSALAL